MEYEQQLALYRRRIKAIIQLLESGTTQAAVAKTFGMTQQRVSQINVNYRRGEYKWLKAQ